MRHMNYFQTLVAGTDGSRIWQGGGGLIFIAKRGTYTSEASYERSEYKSAGGGAPPPDFF